MQVERRDRAAGALPLLVAARDQDDRPVVALDEPRGDDADHALVPALARDDVAAAAPAALGPRLDLRDRLAQDALLDRLALAVQAFELLGELLRLAVVLGQEQRERGLRTAQAAGRVDARREPEADRRLRRRAAGSTPATRISARRPGFCVWASRRSPSSASARFSSTSGTTSATVASATTSRCRSQNGCSSPSSACASFHTTPVPQRPGERVVALERRDDRAGGERLGRPVVVGDDDLEPERPRVLDLGDRGDAAVDGQHEVESLLGEPRERAGVQPVALFEARRQMPRHVCSELAQEQDGERGRADAVGVVVAVDADACAALDRSADRRDACAPCRRAAADRGPAACPSRKRRASSASS